MDMPPDENQDSAQPVEDSSQPQPNEAPETPSTKEIQPEAQAPEEGHRPRSEEAFAEFRRELREEETQEKPGFGPRVRRLLTTVFKRKKKTAGETEAPSQLEEMVIPASSEAVKAPSTSEAASAQEVSEARPEAPAEGGAAEFRSMVRNKLSEGFLSKEDLEPTSPPPDSFLEQPGMQPIAPAVEPAEPEEQPAPGAAGRSILAGLREEQQEVTEEPSSIRQAALEDYVVAPEEAEEEAAPTLTRRLRRSWRDMRPVDRRLLIGALIIIGLAVLSGSAFVVVKSIPTPTVAPTATVSFLPIPVSISLPGGWVFPLSVGTVDPHGVWNPTKPEWLQGTEITRWVSLPWTVQLEAVLRTLKANDEIKLTMSNLAPVTYKVQSIQQIPSGDVGKLAPSTPSLLVILSRSDSSSRWVVVAEP